MKRYRYPNLGFSYLPERIYHIYDSTKDEDLKNPGKKQRRNTQQIHFAMELDKFIIDIENFRPFSFSDIQERVGVELCRSIVRMLKKFGVEENDVFVYDPKLARVRHLNQHTDDTTYYGISYEEISPDEQNEIYHSGLWGDDFKMDGKYYMFTTYIVEELNFIGIATNVFGISIFDIEYLSNVYHYLRMELKKKKSKQRLFIERNGRNYHPRTLSIDDGDTVNNSG